MASVRLTIIPLALVAYDMIILPPHIQRALVEWLLNIQERLESFDPVGHLFIGLRRSISPRIVGDMLLAQAIFKRRQTPLMRT